MKPEYAFKMKHIILVLSLLSLETFALTSLTSTGTIGSPIPVAYSASNPKSRLLGSASTQSKIGIINESASKICVEFQSGSASIAPSTPTSSELCLPAGTNIMIDDGTVGVSRTLYVRSNSGSPITSGYVTFFTW